MPTDPPSLTPNPDLKLDSHLLLDLTPEELVDLQSRLSALQTQLAVLRSADLRDAEPSLPPSLEEQP